MKTKELEYLLTVEKNELPLYKIKAEYFVDIAGKINLLVESFPLGKTFRYQMHTANAF